MNAAIRSVTADNGNYLRVINWSNDDVAYQTVVCEYPVDTPDQFIVRGFKPTDDDDDPSFQAVFEMRELSFTPVSVAGIGEHKNLIGTTPVEQHRDYNNIPRAVLLSLQSIGFTAVPTGTGWSDGV